MKTKILELLTKNVANPVTGIVNTALSLVKDKTKDADQSFIQENVKRGISISSKRMLNLSGFGAILTFAMGDMAVKGITKENGAVLLIGVFYSLVMSLITYLSEKAKKDEGSN